MEVDAAVAHFTIATARVTESSNAEGRILAWNNYGYLGSWLGLCDVATSATTVHDHSDGARLQHAGRFRFARICPNANALRPPGRGEDVYHDRAISSDIGAPIIRLLCSPEIGIPLGVCTGFDERAPELLCA